MTLLDAAIAQGKALSDLKVSLEKLAAHNTQMAEELRTVDYKSLRELMRCDCGKMPNITEEGDSLCPICDSF